MTKLSVLRVHITVPQVMNRNDVTLSALATPPRAGVYHGWLVVGAAFLVALFGWGLGFYGPGVYLVTLQARYGWSAAQLAWAVTVYYLLGASLISCAVARAFERFGARGTILGGAAAMAIGVSLLTLVDQLWQVYAAFAIMSAGWAVTSGAAVNIIVAPWFERRRGLAVSWALNGASGSGVLITPLMMLLIQCFGFAAGLISTVALMLAILVPAALRVLRPKHAGEYDVADRDNEGAARRAAVSLDAPRFRLAGLLGSVRFLTISLPFSLGLTAQVGFLTHQVAFLSPLLGTTATGAAVAVTTFCAVAGRIGTGFFIDRVDRRAAASCNFLLQASGMALLSTTPAPPSLFLGCILFGLGLGNLVSLPGLIVQHEFPAAHFARIVSLVVAINQFTFAFGPALLGQLRQWSGDYSAALLACLAMQVVGAAVVITPRFSKARRM